MWNILSLLTTRISSSCVEAPTSITHCSSRSFKTTTNDSHGHWDASRGANPGGTCQCSTYLGIFPGFWKSKSTEEEPTATRAHMGESNNGQAYYDENLKQWVWTNDQNNGTSQSQVPQHWSPPPTRPPPGPPANGSYPQHTYPIHNRYAAYGMNTY